MKTLIAILSLTAISQSYAYDLSNKFGIGAGAGFPIPIFGNQFNDAADEKWEISAYGRYHLNSSLGFDLGVSKEKFKDTPMYFENINLLTFWRMSSTANTTPLIGLGLGVTSINDYSPKSAKLSVLARLGMEFGLTPVFAIDTMVDYQYISKILGDMPTGEAHVVIPKITLNWYFGGESTKEENKETKPEEKIIEKSAMVEKPKTEPKTETKTDVENVSDVVSVESAATVRSEPYHALTVEFDSSKTDVKEEYNDSLKKIAEELKENLNLGGVIQGYADSTGSKDLNTKLSEKRANAVKEKLIEYGVTNERISTDGFGEEAPIANNKTKEGRQQNRHAEIYIQVQETTRDGVM